MSESTSAPLRWSAYEHEHIERGSDWFWALGVIAISASLTSILLGNLLFAILILVAAGTIALIAQHPPQLHDFEITDKGIQTGVTMHPYENIISFWIDEEVDDPVLLIDTTAFMAPNLIIPLGEMHPETIREFLRERVDEVPMKEPLSHKVLEFFGF